MRGVTHKGHEELTLLEFALRLEGDFRKNLEPLRVTPLQAGLLLFLRRHAEAGVTDAATALGVRLPTMSTLLNALVRKRWVTKRYSIEDRHAVCLSLSRRGEALAQRVKDHVRDVRSDLTLMKEA